MAGESAALVAGKNSHLVMFQQAVYDTDVLAPSLILEMEYQDFGGYLSKVLPCHAGCV
jgi:hypothetical protein